MRERASLVSVVRGLWLAELVMNGLSDLERLFAEWRQALERRSHRGELRPSPEERVALERFVGALEASDPQTRIEWETRRTALESALPLCDCGHPLTHHDPAGSCFHVVGCATGCECNSMRR